MDPLENYKLQRTDRLTSEQRDRAGEQWSKGEEVGDDREGNQSNTSANCGEFCCEFLDKMYHGGKFKQATHYDTLNGERNVEKYKSRWGLL